VIVPFALKFSGMFLADLVSTFKNAQGLAPLEELQIRARKSDRRIHQFN
jgi:hypothetical protein